MKSLLKLSPLKVFVTGLVLFTALFVLWTSGMNSNTKWYNRRAVCSLPAEKLQDMMTLLFRVNATLAGKLKVPYFLCYGTLWGVLRISEILPWDTNIDVCVLNEDIAFIDEAYLIKTFARAGISISYSSINGIYNLKYENAEGVITVFNRNSEFVERAGLHNKVWTANEERIPGRLVQKPYPLADFIDAKFPVPHEDVAIMEYLYPDDWKKLMKPPGC